MCSAPSTIIIHHFKRPSHPEEAAAHGRDRVGEGGDLGGADRAVAVRVKGMVDLKPHRDRRPEKIMSQNGSYWGKYLGSQKYGTKYKTARHGPPLGHCFGRQLPL